MSETKKRNPISRILHNEYFLTFISMFLIAVIIFSIEAASNDFTLPMTGDYQLQSYAFYAQGYNVFWDTVKTGKTTMFDFSNFLGANYYGTQSFYYLFSPLFYLLCLWPEKYLYQGIFFHLVFKYALAGLFFYILLRKYFNISKKIAWAGAFAYALSGWSLFYLWFHYSDVVTFFPLLIMGIEKLLKERKGWLLTLALFLNGITNYFFEVNFAIFGVFYALYRWIYIYGVSKNRGYSAKERWGVLLQGILYYAAGLLLAMFVIYPSVNVAMQSNRASTSSMLLDFLAYFFKNPTRINGNLNLGELKSIQEMFSWENIKELFKYMFVWSDQQVGTYTIPANQQAGYILTSWLFMNTNCWSSTLFSVSSLDNNIGGMFITTPLTMLLIPSIIKVFKEKRPWAIFGVIIGLIIPFIPFTAQIAFAFTKLYGRWQIWIVAVAITFVISSLDKFEYQNRRYFTISLIVHYILSFILIGMSRNSEFTPKNDMFIVVYVELGVMALVWFVYRFKLFKPELVKNIMIVIMVFEIGASTVITIEHKGFYKWDEYYMSTDAFDEMKQVVDDIKAEDDSFYRIDSTEVNRLYVNLPSTLNYNGMSTFNSTYSFDLEPFIRRSRVWYSGGWTMGVHEKRYYLNQYLGVKYFIVDKKDRNNDNAYFNKDVTTYFDGHTRNDEEVQDYNTNIPIGYSLYKEYEYYDVYINNNYREFGHTVDKVANTKTAGTSLTSSKYEYIYNDIALLTEEDYEILSNEFEDLNYSQLSSYINNDYTSYSASNWDYYFSLRESYEEPNEEGKKVRKEYPVAVGSNRITKEEISTIIPQRSQFLHKRWEEREQFGDQIILKAKEGKGNVCPLASDTNKCHINFSFKMGPRVLISLYNDDVLVTQDAHMVTTASLGTVAYEWKNQRGYYVNQPINKIVIEFVQDTPYDKLFNSSGYIPTMDLEYVYEDSINALNNRIKEHEVYDVYFNSDEFEFKTNEVDKRIMVTNIPYDEGWTLKNLETDEKIDIINVNGGFIGFVCPTGETKYKLSYFTPKLKEGIIGSLCGLLLFIILCYIYRNKKAVVHELELMASNANLNDKIQVNLDKVINKEIHREETVKWQNTRVIYRSPKKQK